jgi:hypothetical protein
MQKIYVFFQSTLSLSCDDLHADITMSNSDKLSASTVNKLSQYPWCQDEEEKKFQKEFKRIQQAKQGTRNKAVIVEKVDYSYCDISEQRYIYISLLL